MYNFLITCNLEMPRAERRSFEGVRTFYHLNLLLSSVFHESLKNSKDLNNKSGWDVSCHARQLM